MNRQYFALQPLQLHFRSLYIGPFTALLPTDAAFADLDQGLLDELMLPENIETLRNLLLYHILPGATRTTEFTAGPTDTLFTGNQVEVSLNPLLFDSADVVTPDIVACNGYIDVIDTVLDPFAGRKYHLSSCCVCDGVAKAHSFFIIIFSIS